MSAREFSPNGDRNITFDDATRVDVLGGAYTRPQLFTTAGERKAGKVGLWDAVKVPFIGKDRRVVVERDPTTGKEVRVTPEEVYYGSADPTSGYGPAELRAGLRAAKKKFADTYKGQ